MIFNDIYITFLNYDVIPVLSSNSRKYTRWSVCKMKRKFLVILNLLFAKNTKKMFNWGTFGGLFVPP